MLGSGYVRIYRSFLNWEWYTDQNTKSVFLHLILTANWTDKKWRGTVVKRGQRVYSSQKLADELHMSRQETRTAIKHLISTGEITNLSTPKYSIITVKNYELYQQPTNELTNDQPTGKNVPETPMNAGLEGNIFQNQHNKNIENSTSNSTSKPTNDKFIESQHESLENVKSGAANQPTSQPSNQPTPNQLPTNYQPQLKKDKESNKDKKGNRENIKEIFSDYAGNDKELLNALNDFAEMRKSIKKPLSTARAAKILLTSLDKLTTDGKEKIAILNQSIFKNWQGVFPLKGDDCNAGQVANNGENNGARSGGSAEKIPQYGKVY